MFTPQNPDLETLYKQFDLGKLPIFQNQQLISIQKLFRILTNTKLEDLSAAEAINFYLYCNFFKNRLLYSEIFRDNLTYIISKSIELKQRIRERLDKYDQMIKEIKSESDNTWIDNNIIILNDSLIMLDSIPTRCDYYDKKVSLYLRENQTEHNPNPALKTIEEECAAEFTRLAQLSSEAGMLI